MKKSLIRLSLLTALVGLFSLNVDAQTKKKRTATKRVNTKTAKTTKGKTKTKVTGGMAEADPNAAVAAAPDKAVNDSLPIPKVRRSLRPDEAVETQALKDRSPLTYEHLRADDAVFRHKIWRDIDAREKINKPFVYSADADNGNQRFISILLQAIQDSAVTVFDPIDDRFTTPLTKAKVAENVGGGTEDVDIYNERGEKIGTKTVAKEINLDSFYKFRIKEEVIFDKESSRLFWRILGIAPIKRIITSMGVDLGETELFWVYYPDLRPVLAKYDIYNPKNASGSMSWEELFESRMFYGRIIKTTLDNSGNQYIKNYKGLQDNPILQLLEGERITETIFNYEQDQWSY